MKKALKKLVAMLLVGMMALSMTGCGEAKQAEKAVTKMMDAFQVGDMEEAQKYVDISRIEESTESEDESSDRILEIIFQNMEYQILSSNRLDGNTVDVRMEITTVDMGKVMQNYFVKMLEYAFSNMDASEEEMDGKAEELLEDCIREVGDETVTNETTVTVLKGDDGWKVETSDEFINALLGGLPTATANMEANFEK